MRTIIDKIKKSENETVEEYLKFYMKQTGLDIDDIMLVHKIDPGSFQVVVYATPKKEFERRLKDGEVVEPPTITWKHGNNL
jgi:hypothetical protein